MFLTFFPSVPPAIEPEKEQLVLESGQLAVLHCNATGSPEPIISWIKATDPPVDIVANERSESNGNPFSEYPHFLKNTNCWVLRWPSAQWTRTTMDSTIALPEVKQAKPLECEKLLWNVNFSNFYKMTLIVCSATQWNASNLRGMWREWSAREEHLQARPWWSASSTQWIHSLGRRSGLAWITGKCDGWSAAHLFAK